MERRDRCPCRRSPATADAGGGYGLPGIACPSFTAVEPTAQVRLRTPLLSLAGQEAFGRATADQSGSVVMGLFVHKLSMNL